MTLFVFVLIYFFYYFRSLLPPFYLIYLSPAAVDTGKRLEPRLDTHPNHSHTPHLPTRTLLTHTYPAHLHLKGCCVGRAAGGGITSTCGIYNLVLSILYQMNVLFRLFEEKTVSRMPARNQKPEARSQKRMQTEQGDDLHSLGLSR